MSAPETLPDTGSDTVSIRTPIQMRGLRTISAPRQDFGSLLPRRLPKFTRAKSSWRPPLVLQKRDLALLQVVADYRLLSTPQYLLLFPDSCQSFTTPSHGGGWSEVTSSSAPNAASTTSRDNRKMGRAMKNPSSMSHEVSLLPRASFQAMPAIMRLTASRTQRWLVIASSVEVVRLSGFGTSAPLTFWIPAAE